MPFPGVTYINELSAAVLKELEQFASLLEGYLRKEHKADGSHGAITADSLTTTETVTVGGEGVFNENVTADADGDPVIVGALSTTAGFVNAQSGMDMRSSAGGTVLARYRLGTTGGAGRQLLFCDLLGTPGVGGYTLRLRLNGTVYTLEPDAGVFFKVSATTLSGTSIEPVQKFVVGTAMTAPQITADQDDYHPTGLLTSLTVFISSDAARNITGFAAGVDGQRIRLINGGNFTVTLKYNSVLSAVGNRIIPTGSADYLLLASASVDMEYQSANWWVIR